MQDLIGYDEIIENSMRMVIYETLKKIEKSGVIGNHYFIITFLTSFRGVEIPKIILDKYPQEMTIAIQHQFKNLKVSSSNLSISLSFSGTYYDLKIPYKAITSFNDPSMNFGLKFSINKNFNDEEEDFENNQIDNDEAASKKIDTTAKVVSLDAFRASVNSNKNKPNNEK